MKVNEKQVSDFGDIFLDTVKKIVEHDNIVTVTLADDTNLSFFTPEHSAVAAEKGETGDKGYSAYDLYRQGGGSLSVTAWVDSLKGPAGAKGWRGYQGDRGEQGEPGASFVPEAGDIFLTDDDTATAALSGNKISLTVPAVKADDFKEEPLHLGMVTTLATGNSAAATLKKTGDDAEISLAFPKGVTGPPGDDAAAAVDGRNPYVTVNVSMDKKISLPSMEATTLGNMWNFNIIIPEGKQGDIGGIRENSAQDRDISYLEIVTMEGLINAPPFESFMPIAVTVNDSLCYGWSFRDGVKNGFITQTVWDDKGKRWSREKAEGYVFAGVTEGWQEGG